MALQKRLDYGFNGCQVPFIPRRSRSARVRRGTFRKKVEDRQMCAFELLATVAGKLLAEKESSSGNSKKSSSGNSKKSSSGSNDASDGKSEIAIVKDTVKQERQEVDKFVKVEKHENGFDETVLGSQLGLQGKKRIYNSKEFSDADVGIGQLSGVDNAGRSDEFGCAKWKTVKNKNEVRKFPKDESHSPDYGQTREVKVVDKIGRQKKVDSMINGSVQNMCSSEDLMELDTKPPALIGSDSSINVPISETHTPRVSFSEFSDDNKVVNTDDDENSSGCTKLSTINMKSFRSYKHIGGRRTGKLMASKYWKVAPKLKDGQRSKTDMKLIFHNSKNVTRQRSQGNSPFKKRKLFRQSSVLAFEGGTTDEGVSGSSEKDIVGDTSSAGSGESSTVSGKEALFQARDSHVKLHIKSFKIPELCIDVPETATVGSLKRTVMEAVTAILGGGLRVGMVLKGKTVRDDNKTLAQTGISHEDQLANIGFTLEPNPAHTLQANHREDSSYLVPDTPQPLTRYLTTPTSDTRVSNTSLYPRKRNLGNFVESDHDAVLSPTETSADKTTQNSRALVSMPTVRMDALAVVPLQRKSRQADLVQRRIRRPFSVSEVEALVQAVEKLGTGRWRDVKNRAFDDAEHRTYVDLKDKWKTLVHTAQISPQQRRGEPVPQELLDRVLRAHGHWSQQQAKQQVKNETCLLL